MIDIEQMKADFLGVYRDTICAEAVLDVEAATDVASFVKVLNKHIVTLGAEQIPSIGWVRKWLSNEKVTLNQCGIYLDQRVILSNPNIEIICMGNCSVIGTYSDLAFHRIFMLDDSSLEVNALQWTCVFVVLKGHSTAKVNFHSPHARVHILDKR